LRVLEATAFRALDHEPIDAGIDRFQGGLQRRHDVKHDQPRLLQRPAIFRRIAGRGGDELHALIDDELHDVGIAHEGLRNIDAERLLGQLAHLGDLAAHGIKLA